MKARRCAFASPVNWKRSRRRGCAPARAGAARRAATKAETASIRDRAARASTRPGIPRTDSLRLSATLLAETSVKKAPTARANSRRASKRRAGTASSESVANLHPPACSDFAHDGRSGSGWYCRVPAIAGLGSAAGRLSHDPGSDVLSGRGPGGDDVRGYRAAGKAVRAGAGAHANDVDQLLRQF